MPKLRQASILAAMLIFCIISTQIQVRASMYDDRDSFISIQWVNVLSAEAGISASGKTLSPKVAIIANNGSSKISGTLYLERLSNGTWVNVTSWSVSGTGILQTSKSYTGTSGITYRARFAGTVVTEAVECSSSSCTL